MPRDWATDLRIGGGLPAQACVPVSVALGRQGHTAANQERTGPGYGRRQVAGVRPDTHPHHAPRTRDLWPAPPGRPALISACAYVDSQGMDEITILQAEVLKTLASPRRLEILHVLARGPIEVGHLAEAIGATQPNVSQHLATLRASGIVEAERDGREVRYRLVDPDVMTACGIMRAVLERRLRRLADLSTASDVKTESIDDPSTRPYPRMAAPR